MVIPNNKNIKIMFQVQKKFNNEKINFLSKIDKSKRGSIDKAILPLCNKLNKKKEYYTTSSCSGRSVALETSKDKSKCNWVFETHEKVRLKDLMNNLTEDIISKIKNPIWFKFEPMLLHVACLTIQKAQDLVNIARNIGFKKAGIISTNKKILVEIGSFDIIETIIADKGKLIVDDFYLKILVEQANEKFKYNKEKIKKLKNRI